MVSGKALDTVTWKLVRCKFNNNISLLIFSMILVEVWFNYHYLVLTVGVFPSMVAKVVISWRPIEEKLFPVHVMSITILIVMVQGMNMILLRIIPQWSSKAGHHPRLLRELPHHGHMLLVRIPGEGNQLPQYWQSGCFESKCDKYLNIPVILNTNINSYHISIFFLIQIFQIWQLLSIKENICAERPRKSYALQDAKN